MLKPFRATFPYLRLKTFHNELKVQIFEIIESLLLSVLYIRDGYHYPSETATFFKRLGRKPELNLKS